MSSTALQTMESSEYSMSRTKKAYKNLEFLNSPAARTIRIVCEYEEPRQRFEDQGVSDTVVLFGSARTLSHLSETPKLDVVGTGWKCNFERFDRTTRQV